MGRLIYSMITSLDGYVSGPDGGFDWALDEELHDFINRQFADVRTYLYGRRMYETMVYWETAHLEPDQPQVGIDYARVVATEGTFPLQVDGDYIGQYEEASYGVVPRALTVVA